MTTRRGELRGGPEEANYGFDITGEIGSTNSAQRRAALPGKIRNEALKDDRLINVETTVHATLHPNGLETWEVEIVGYTREGPFELVIGVDGVDAKLLRLGEAS